jgi:deoxyribose-phosphate aldolase
MSNETKIKLTLTKKKIKSAASMVDMMMAGGSLYEEHPIYDLINEIIEECIKIKKGKKNV